MRSLSTSYALRKRLILLASCSAVGCAAGFIGSSVTGSEGWYLAVPLVIAIAWLFVAKPSECEAPLSPPERVRPGSKHNAP
jgi:hypothetical protein